MDAVTTQSGMRRSTRVRACIPLTITSLDSAVAFSEQSETVLVSANGCVIRSSSPVKLGTPVRLQVGRDQRETTARVVFCQALGGEKASWVIGLDLKEPGNVWGLKSCPADWARYESKSDAPDAAMNSKAKMAFWPLASPASAVKSAERAKVSDPERQKQFEAQQANIAALEERLSALESMSKNKPAETSLDSVTEQLRRQLAEFQQTIEAKLREQLQATLARSSQEQSSTTATLAKLEARLAALETLPKSIEKQSAANLEWLQTSFRKEVAEMQASTVTQAREELMALVETALAESSSSAARVSAKLEQRVAALESAADQLSRHVADGDAEPSDHSQPSNSEIAQAIKRLQEELSIIRQKAGDAQEIRAAVAEQFAHLPSEIQAHAQAAFQQLQDEARSELQQLIAQAGAKFDQESERHAALQAAAETLQKDIDGARASLESSLQLIPERIHEPIAGAVQQALAHARADISGEIAQELEKLRECRTEFSEQLAGANESLRNERETITAEMRQAARTREDLSVWLKEQQDLWATQTRANFEQLAAKQSEYAAQLRRELEECTRHLSAKSAAIAEENVKADIEDAISRAHASLDQRLGPTLDRGSRLSQELSTLVETLRAHAERYDAQVRALAQERVELETWIAQHSARFQESFNSALLETTGHIKGKLQLAVEMIEQPVEKLRLATARELQEEANRQATEIRKSSNEAAERLHELRRAIETSVRDSLRAQAAETCSVAGRQMAQLAQNTVQEWLSSLAKNLETIRGTVSQRRQEADSSESAPAQ